MDIEYRIVAFTLANARNRDAGLNDILATLDEGWDIMRCDATAESLVYIFLRDKPSKPAPKKNKA